MSQWSWLIRKGVYVCNVVCNVKLIMLLIPALIKPLIIRKYCNLSIRPSCVLEQLKCSMVIYQLFVYFIEPLFIQYLS